ncbi:MAG TPA: hypothetical protein VM032_08300 [Vicinamibacterales bacterium]|nr:hypothetical protein [Vicinamibacterales bacterium]
MQIRSALVLLAACLLSACSAGGGLFKAYEYEEEMYIALDGTATVYVNSSVAALNALRGSSFDTDPAKAPDREAVRAFFTGPNVTVNRVTLSRRSNRRYVHVRLAVADVEKLSESTPFAWSTYSFKRDGDLFYYKQNVGASAAKDVGDVGWRGSEIVGFRMHLPSKIAYHNAGAGNLLRGNILVWEQSLAERRQGASLTLDARMETQSILYRTLALFGATFVAVAALFAVLLWTILRRGRNKPARA